MTQDERREKLVEEVAKASITYAVRIWGAPHVYAVVLGEKWDGPPSPTLIERAAEAICALHEDLARTPWSEWGDQVRDRYRTDARAALSVIPEAAEWEADAARYRWLRSRDLDTIDAGGIFIGRVPENTVINGEDADRAIDAAISPRIKDNANG
jgi:hypothetical protein